jgi:hypothetical protein
LFYLEDSFCEKSELGLGNCLLIDKASCVACVDGRMYGLDNLSFCSRRLLSKVEVEQVELLGFFYSSGINVVPAQHFRSAKILICPFVPGNS